MNKKIITSLILCIFTFEPICWAKKIIVETDRQARYVNQEISLKTQNNSSKTANRSHYQYSNFRTTTSTQPQNSMTQTQITYQTTSSLQQKNTITQTNNAQNIKTSTEKQATEVKMTQKPKSNQQQLTREQELAEYDELNYKASSINMNLAQAVAGRYEYFKYIENNPKLMKEYYLFRDNNIDIDELSTRFEYTDSFFDAVKEGFIPKYTIRYGNKLFANKTMMNSLLDIARLMRANNFSENQIKNIFILYLDSFNEDKKAVSISDIEAIINNKSLTQNDKFYSIVAKLEAKHYKKPNVETDILNAYQILKKQPEIIDNKFDKSNFQDSTLRILTYYPKATKTSKIISTNLNIPNLTNGEKYYRILGELKVYILKNKKQNYPSELYEIAKTGILEFRFSEDDLLGSCGYLSHESSTLYDILNASKTLMKNDYWEWENDNIWNIFLITPKSCKTNEIVTKVINDSKIPFNNKEAIIIKHLLKILNDNETKEENKTPEIVYKVLEEGYYPKYFYYHLFNDNCSYLEKKYNYVKKMKNEDFNSDEIEFVTKYIHAKFDDIIYILNDNSMDNRKKYLSIVQLDSNYNQEISIIKKLVENGILVDKNILNTNNISKLKTNINYKDVHKIVLADDNTQLESAINLVGNDNNIRLQDKLCFMYTYVASQPPYERTFSNKLDEEIYKIMKCDLRYDKKKIYDFDFEEDSESFIRYKKKILNDSKLNNEQKIKKIRHKQNMLAMKREIIYGAKEFANVIACICLAPIAILLVIVMLPYVVQLFNAWKVDYE